MADEVKDDGEILSLPLVGGPGKTFGEMTPLEREIATLEGALAVLVGERDQMKREYDEVLAIQEAEITRLRQEIAWRKGEPA
jgi:hypothetical protein